MKKEIDKLDGVAKHDLQVAIDYVNEAWKIRSDFELAEKAKTATCKQSRMIGRGDFILSPFPEDANPNGIYEVVDCTSNSLKVASISSSKRVCWIPAKSGLFYRLTKAGE